MKNKDRKNHLKWIQYDAKTTRRAIEVTKRLRFIEYLIHPTITRISTLYFIKNPPLSFIQVYSIGFA